MSSLLKWLCCFSVAGFCGSAFALENRLDAEQVSYIRALVGADSATGVIAVTFSNTGNISTHLDPNELSPGGMAAAAGNVTNFSFSFSADHSRVTATFNGNGLGQDLPVTETAETFGSLVPGVSEISSAAASQVKTLLSVDSGDAMLVLTVGASGFLVYKSVDEFNQPGLLESVGSVVSGATVFPQQSLPEGEAGQAAATEGCTTYYVTIGGNTYTYVVCD